MNFEERALSFRCGESSLYGIISLPTEARSRGILIVVGGPQYRAGSHRQFVLLARELAACGIPAMRFDYRGMGDSDGGIRNFENVGEDISHAIDRFFAEVPSMREVVIWGLCDAASAALFYGHNDPRVTGMVLLNPWVTTDEGLARVYLKHYYLARLADRGLWKKIASGRFDFAGSIKSLLNLASKANFRSSRISATESTAGTPTNGAPLQSRMYEGFVRFRGNVLLVMSGNDLTAREFSEMVKSSRKWQQLLADSRVQRRDLPQANHTFSQRDWRDQVAFWTKDWILSW